jgi:hypothetical protein
VFEIRIFYKSVVCEFGVQYRKAFFYSRTAVLTPAASNKLAVCIPRLKREYIQRSVEGWRKKRAEQKCQK